MGIRNQDPRTKNVRALAKLFFGRLFDNDTFSSSAAASAGVMWLLALVSVPGVMFSGTQVFSWTHIRAMSIRRGDPMLLDSALMTSQAFHIDFVMGVTGLITMLVWGSLTPDRRDALVLGPLPITSREQAYGRLLALLKFCGLFIAAMSIPTALAFNLVSGGPEDVFRFPSLVLGHIVAASLAGGAVFFLLLNAQLVLAALWGPRAIRFVTLPLQLAALAGMIAALATTEGFAKAMLTADANSAAGLLWNPAAWFAGVYRWIAGDPRPIFEALAARGAIAGLGITALAVVLYPLAYERCLRNVVNSEGRTMNVASRGWAAMIAAALRPFLRTPLQRGLSAYMVATLARSQTHRFLIGSYAGIAFLLALPIADRLVRLPTTEHLRYAWFSIPLGLVFWLVCGVRVSLMMPVEIVANWLFRLTEPVDKRRLLSTVVTVMAFVTCLPVATLFSAALLLLGEQTLAATVFLFVMLGGLCLIELLTITMKTVPFTCTYLPGQLRLRVMWPLYFYLWLQFVHRFADWGVWAVGNSQRTLRVSVFLIVLWASLRIWHMAKAKKIGAFVYDEQEPALVTTMDISTMMRQI